METETPTVHTNKSKFIEKIKDNPWVLATILLAIICVPLIIFSFTGILGNSILGITGNAVSGDNAGDSVVEYLNARTGGGVEYISSEDIGNLYEITVSYKGENIPVYTTKDGEYYIQGAIQMTGQAVNQEQQPTQQPQDVVKSDKPKVELFVMTHCPYGTQAEKGIVPVFNLLENKIDSSIKFVHYFLHEPEETETPVQICIREEQGDKYLDYLACFLEDGDTERCLTETGIDKNKLDSCGKTKYDDLYAADSALSEGYGVRGSPTLVINGQIVNSGRSPDAYLNSICSAFTDGNIPEECDEQLNTASPSAGFGYTASAGGSTNAQC